MSQLAGALEFFFGDGLTWDDIFDWHNLLILPLSRLPQGGEANAPQTKVNLPQKITTTITRPAPFPFGKGGGLGSFRSRPRVCNV